MSFTTQELIECAQREVAKRLNDRKWDGYMLLPLTGEQLRETQMMEAIVGLLKSQELDLHMAYTRIEQLANQLGQCESALEIAHSKL